MRKVKKLRVSVVHEGAYGSRHVCIAILGRTGAVQSFIDLDVIDSRLLCSLIDQAHTLASKGQPVRATEFEVIQRR